MRRLLLLVTLLWLICDVSFVQAESSVRESIRAEALVMADATRAGQYDKLIDLTYPKLVELFGGREKMRDMIRNGMEDMARRGVKFDPVVIGEPSEPVTSGGKMYVIVPETTHLKGPHGKVDTEGYLLAISTDQGKSWTFLDGSGIDPDKLKIVLPDFPPTLKLPPKPKPKFTPTS